MWIAGDGERSADREINAPTPFEFDFDRSVEYKKSDIAQDWLWTELNLTRDLL